MRGEAPPIPYASVEVADRARLRDVAARYRAVLAGTLPPEEMPDVGDLVKEELRPYVGMAPKAKLDAMGVLRHMCRRCHNPSLDPLITRALFDVDELADMPRAEKDEAIRRLTMSDASGLRMPPSRFALLGEADIARLTALLRR